jgi:ketosteroid isomerase-like protein
MRTGRPKATLIVTDDERRQLQSPAKPQPIEPVLFSGKDLGFRMTARKEEAPVGQLVARVDGEWKEVQTMAETLGNVDESSAQAVYAVADEEFHVMESGNAAAFVALLAPDAIFLPPNDSPKEGAAVGPWMAEFLEGFKVHFQEREHEEIVMLGEWAVLRTSFRWSVVPRTEGDALVRFGNTVRFFRRGRTGSWRLAREIWNTYPTGA